MNYVDTGVKSEIKVPMEVYSRVSGYYRPVSQWNRGKQEENRERVKCVIQKLVIYRASTRDFSKAVNK